MMIPPHWQLIGSKFCITPPPTYTLLVTPPSRKKSPYPRPVRQSAWSLVEFLMYRQKERYSLRLNVKLKFFDFLSI